jgi:hypothetical protein
MKSPCFLEAVQWCAEVAQPGRALDSVINVAEGEAEDRVVACSNPALGTIKLLLSLMNLCFVYYFVFCISYWRFLYGT